MKSLRIYDPRIKWVEPALHAARPRGWDAKQINGDWSGEDCYLLYFPHAHPGVLERDKRHAGQLASLREQSIRWVTDLTQILCYEDKVSQFKQWGKWMPDTWVFTDLDSAMSLLAEAEYPLVSKAAVGASSMNVRILASQRDAEFHVKQLFGGGLMVHHCDSQGTQSRQRGYVLLQQHLSHDVTWRVNAVGRQRVAFKRYNFPDRQVAETGNVRPVVNASELPEGLMEFSDAWFKEAATKWCAIDVLWDGINKRWRFLESSPRWPNPSPGDCDNGVFFMDGKPSGRKWREQFQAMMDELESGTFSLS